MNTEFQRAVLAAVVMLLTMSMSAQSPADIRELDAAVRAARDGDLRADWGALLDARARVAASHHAADAPALVSYHLAYIDWRLSSLAYLVTGVPGMTPLLERAVEHLRSAVAVKPTFAEAHALLAMCAGVLVGGDRSRIEELMPLVKASWAAALEHGAENPRVQLLRAMMEFFVPPQFGGNRERGLERWRESIRLFEQEEKRRIAGGEPRWGHAEAWAWLGGAYLMVGQHQDARAALEASLRLRPDFWWAARAALPQARRPVTK